MTKISSQGRRLANDLRLTQSSLQEEAIVWRFLRPLVCSRLSRRDNFSPLPLLTAASCLVLLCACVSAWRAENIGASVAHSPPVSDAPELCIALSGGGIRAGAVALGALQAFYDHGLLQRASYVASVSGGGYPIYGILAQSTKNNATLESLLRSDSKYVAAVGENTSFIDSGAMFNGAVGATTDWALSHSLNFFSVVSLGDVVHGRLLPRYFIRHGALSGAYATDIDKTFGPRVAPIMGVRLGEAKIPSGFPTPIIVGSYVSSPELIFNGRFSSDPTHLFEFSPSWVGSLGTGYWSKVNPRLTVNDAVVASAAAVDAPFDQGSDDFQLPDWVKRIGVTVGISFYLPDMTRVYVADGGFIENQGVLPLIERNCGNIVAVDASFDPKADMHGWTILSNLAPKIGKSVEPVVPIEPTSTGATSAWNLPSHLYKTSYHALGEVDATRTITILKLGIHQGEIYDKAIEKFEKKNWEANSAQWNSDTECNSLDKLQHRCNFPMESTANQSYAKDEFEAYRLMGRHLVQLYCVLHVKTADKIQCVGSP